MDLREFLAVLWRRKLVVLLVTAAAVAAAFGALKLVTPLYQSTATLAVTPADKTSDLFILTTINTVLPVYATAATSRTTLEEARARVPGGGLADVSTRTFADTPILKIQARDPDPEIARATAQAVTDVLLRRANSGELGLPSLVLRPIEQPIAATAPVFPRRKLTLLVAGLLGLALGIGAALLRELLTSKVQTRDDLAHATDSPVFAQFSTERAVARVRTPEAIGAEAGLRVFSEGLRDLRTNLLFTSGGSVRSVAVTSPEGSHGKTTISFGLATTLARSGTRTLLVDADLRKGRVSELLRIARSPGLREALAGAPLEEAIQRTSLPTLDVLPGGAIADDPGEALLSEFAPVLARLEDMYDTVIIDCTPLVPVNDARLVARATEAVVLVASAGTVTRRQLRAAVERLSLLAIPLTAAVLNNAKRPRGKAYYGYFTPDGGSSRWSLRRRRPAATGDPAASADK
jgi:capsular exopolysaccharide synthesis family protein